MQVNQSNQLYQRAQLSIPGGVNSPVRAFKSVGMNPLFIESASGSRIKDVDGNEYIDYVGSWGPMILGHAHPAVLEAVTQAANKGLSFGAPTEAEIELAELMKEMVSSLEMVRMVNSGTEATMSAIRAARGFTGRDKIIKFIGCYHGHADHLLVKAGSGALTLGAPDSPGVPAAFAGETLLARYNHFEDVQDHIDNYPGEIAAIIIEPIAGNMGMIPPQGDFLQKLRTACDIDGIVLILDEVMTGFRVAAGGAQELYGVMPDLSTFGKIMGGGMPVGAYGGRKDIMSQVSPAGSIYQAGTLSGNPVAMAAGLATLKEINKPGFYEDLGQKTNWLMNELRDIFTKASIPHSITHAGSMFGLFLNEKPVHSFEEAITSDTDTFAKLFRNLLIEGVYIAPSAFESGFVSSAHTEEDLQKTADAYKKAVGSL